MTQAARAESCESSFPMSGAAEAPPLATRFGALAQDPERIIVFPHGLLGFADQHRYLLADIPGRPGATTIFSGGISDSGRP